MANSPQLKVDIVKWWNICIKEHLYALDSIVYSVRYQGNQRKHWWGVIHYDDKSEGVY